MDQINPGIGSMHPLPPDNFQHSQHYPSGEGFKPGKESFDEIIPDGIPASIKPFLIDLKPNGGSVVFQPPEAEPVDFGVERRSNRRKVATGLIAAALVVGVISIGRFFLKK